MKKWATMLCLLFALTACGQKAKTERNTNPPQETREEIPLASIAESDLPKEEPIIELNAEVQRPEIEPSEEETSNEEPIESEEAAEEISEPPTMTVENPSVSNQALNWGFRKNKDHLPPPMPGGFDITPFDAYYLGDTDEKVVYLTFDEGYENGFTADILGTLKEKNVPAAFFMTGSYIKKNPDLVLRIANEGHLGVNHSHTHPSLPDLTDEQIVFEIEEPARLYQEITGQDMPKYIRPPQGVYSERVLQTIKNLGYKTIFWSFAYKDWLVDEQPTPQAAHDEVLANHHPGAIILLHAVSAANTAALPDIIDSLRAKGYRFAVLDELSLTF